MLKIEILKNQLKIGKIAPKHNMWNFQTYFEANSASKGAGMGSTGRSFVEIPRCWRDMCEWSELRDFATVPHKTHRYPGHTVCLSSIWVRRVCALR